MRELGLRGDPEGRFRQEHRQDGAPGGKPSARSGNSPAGCAPRASGKHLCPLGSTWQTAPPARVSRLERAAGWGSPALGLPSLYYTDVSPCEGPGTPGNYSPGVTSLRKQTSVPPDGTPNATPIGVGYPHTP